MYTADDALSDAQELFESKALVNIEAFRRLRDYLLIQRRNENIPELLRSKDVLRNS